MELLYVWTESFNVLHEFSLNLSNKVKFEIVDGKLIGRKGQDFLFPINYHDRIKSLKVIVGENGSGKSTILNLIRILCASEHDLRGKDNVVSGLAVFDTGVDKYSFIYSGKLPFELTEDTFVEISIKENQILNDLAIVYYSGAFEYSQKNTYDNIHCWDISTYGELKSTTIKHDLINRDKLEKWDNIYSQFRYDEIERQLDLICSDKIKIPFELPTRLEWSFNKFTNSYDLYRYEGTHKELNSTSLIIAEFIEEFNNAINYEKANSNELLKLMLLRESIIGYIEIMVSKTMGAEDQELIASKIEKLSPGSLKKRYIDFFNSFNVLNDNIYSFDGQKLLDFWEKFSVVAGPYYIHNGKSYLTIDTLDNLRVHSLLNEYFDLEFYPNLINFSWQDLSTGEINFLNLLSRLYAIKKIKTASHILLMIDEGDLALHPEWQRQYINFIVKNIAELFDKSNFQLILTTHSPIILSDIPDYDIIYKFKNKEIPEIKTFGANINELYAHSFFMNHVMGDFSKSVIEKLLGDIFECRDKGIISKNEYEKFIDHIQIIGDELIKDRLLEILELIPKDFQDLEKELIEAEKRVLELKSKLKNGK